MDEVRSCRHNLSSVYINAVYTQLYRKPKQNLIDFLRNVSGSDVINVGIGRKLRAVTDIDRSIGLVIRISFLGILKTKLNLNRGSFPTFAWTDR
jgi:hypothetical protein